MKQSHKTLLLWILLILMFLAIWQFVSPDTPRAAQVPFSEFVALVKAAPEDTHVESVTIKDREYTFTVYDPASKQRSKKVTLGPAPTDDVLKLLEERKVKLAFEKDEGSPFWSSALITVLPMIFLLVMFYLFMRQLQAGGGKAMSFGKSKARMLSETQNKVTFADVAGINEAKDELEEIIAFLRDPKKFQRLGGRIPKGVLMMGPPGTGKTLLARAIAGEAGVPFFSISGSDFVEMFVGVGASRVRDLFEQGKKHAPCIIFIDEIDAVGRHRGAGLGGGHDEREQTLNQLLVEMDGFESNEGVIIIAATNRPDVLDPAILRPGRFDRRITVPRPDVVGREGILRVHTKKVPLAEDVELETIARGTPGFVGADLENLVNEAALLAARQDKEAVSMADIEMAKDKVLMGTERRSMVMSEQERRIAAWHEAGHTLVGMFIEGNDEIHKVSIIPRGAALGVTQFLPTEDRHMMSRQQALARIAMALGGRSAEEIVFGEITTGASNDIQRATQIARMMVCEVGMSEKLGPVSYGEREDSIFLGREFAQHRPDYSEKTAIDIDEEIKRIINEQHTRAKNVLTQYRDALDRLAQALLERETLDQDEIRAVIDGRTLPQRERVVIPTWAERAEQSKDKKRGTSIFGPPKPATSN
ncbi:MAG TPA: ATP-dependent zinc metalloprotease FtsH [Polyangiaceae bacterium]|nr:MAG: ATP-dependent zinc metalloprotease FtsH [Deltaproteobacteria bacterium ADurb.Bin207]HNZ25066.1 ATP-dependent zinc metalloprotease FtsH [Polyangiaceae bacterium]HOD24420.1 ATP-dependent zinc metalloprotease FtsH [Polyangiaceae bacterium]HOE49938.1 ATP-dependent zinc metalloprotease FtsH [Polyangiaceae bacterium]HOH03133.1 ATP-dependent zinc metalloprotease FtsH [Polyangiaceae bacterium]